jgi:ProP effector
MGTEWAPIIAAPPGSPGFKGVTEYGAGPPVDATVATPEAANTGKTASRPEPDKPSRHSAAIATLCILRARFPQTFPRLSARKRVPLAVGIDRDIAAAAPDLDPIAISVALGFWTSGEPYLATCIEGAPRIDLAGKPAGAVTARQAAHATARLQKWQRREPIRRTAKPITLGDLRAAALRRGEAAP